MLSDRINPTPNAMSLIRFRLAHVGRPAVVGLAAVKTQDADGIAAKWQGEADAHADARGEPRPTLEVLNVTPITAAELEAMRGRAVCDGFAAPAPVRTPERPATGQTTLDE